MSNKTSYNVKNKSKVVEPVYDFPVKPDPWTFKRALYDERDGSYFGRTPKNWGKLLIFYTIFYICLAAFCGICLQGLLATLSDDYPRWQLEDSIIGASPGMSFRPVADFESGIDVMAFNKTSEKEKAKLISSMNTFLLAYTNASRPNVTKRVHCDYGKVLKPDEVCIFEFDAPKYDVCGDNTTYGINVSAPCVFLKLNKIYGWIPDCYNDIDNLPSDMPADLVAHIKEVNVTERNQIWISCKGRKPNTVKEIIYKGGNRGFPGYYYPYVKQDGYQSPLAVVQIFLEQSEIDANRQVDVECRTWAKNIIYNGSSRDRQGSILIELAIGN